MTIQSNGETEDNLAELPTLPPGWCWTTLAAVAAIDGGITKDQKRERTPTMGEVPYLRVANVQRGYLDLEEIKTIWAEAEEIDALQLRKGDILFNEGGDRDKLGRGWVWNGEIEECIHQNHVFRARPCLPHVESKFVSFHGNFFGQKWFTQTGKQTTNLASINKGVLSRFPVPLAPLNEQRRIVAKLEELLSDLDAGVAALERVRAKLKRYRAAVLKAAVEGRLTANWREQHPAAEPASELLDRILDERRRLWETEQEARFTAAKKTPPKNWRENYVEPPPPDSSGLPQLPQGWCWTTMDAISSVVGGVTKGQRRNGEASYRQVPYLRVANVQRGFLDLSEMKAIDATERDIADLRLQPGDILFNEGGDRDKLGRGWVWGGEIEECIHQNHVFRARLFLPELQSKFFSHHGNSFGREWFTREGKQSVNLASINLTVLKRFPIPLPPVAEQREMLNAAEQRLSIIDAADQQIEVDLVGCDLSIPGVSQQEKGFGRSARRLSSYESPDLLLAEDGPGGHSGGSFRPPNPARGRLRE